MADLYDILDCVVDERRPTRTELVEYCKRRLAEPMTDETFKRIMMAVKRSDRERQR
jgi:hypothetical protein